MFSKTIFKQTLKQNWKLWAIFTALTAAMGAIIIVVFDPRMMQQMMDVFAEMPGMERMGEMVGESFSFLGMIGETFYSMQGLILPLVFVIMTANSLIASQVDRGSMAYTLSTPIKRVKVVCTQAIYMILSVIAMFAVVTIVGLGSVQLAHNGLWGQPYTPDVVAASEILGQSRSEVSADLNLIVHNPEAFTAGAQARRIDEDVYGMYLTMKIFDNALIAASDVLGMTQDEITDDLNVLLASNAAINAMAEIMWMESIQLRAMIQAEIDSHAAEAEMDEAVAQAMMENMIAGMEAAAEVLGMEVDALGNNMGRIKNDPAALAAMSEASGMEPEMVVMMINMQLAQNELELDQPIDFDVMAYVNLNLGIALLLFAIGGISFMFSCIFNLTKNSLALGAGIPIAFLILDIMASTSSDLEGLRFLTINTLYDPSAITSGGTFVPQFIVLAVVGAVLYLVGIKVFKSKDLPL